MCCAREKFSFEAFAKYLYLCKLIALLESTRTKRHELAYTAHVSQQLR